MNFLTNKFFLIMFLLLLSGCASVEVYDRNSSMKDGVWNGKQSGVKFYAPKPYLLVENTGKKEEPVKTSIIYLPNYDEPQYAKFKPGYGKADLSLKLNNGILTEFGGSGESGDIAALLDSVTGGYKTVIEALKVRQETKDARNANNDSNDDVLQGLAASDYISASKELTALSKNINAGIDSLKQAGDLDSSNLVFDKSDLVVAKIESVAKLLLDKKYLTSDSFDVTVILSELSLAQKEFNQDGGMIIDANGIDSLKIYTVNANSWNIKLQSIIKKLTPDAKPVVSKPAFELYELIKSGGNLVLRKVTTQ